MAEITHHHGSDMNHKYRKKPIVIEAYRWHNESQLSYDDWPDWLKEANCLCSNKPGAFCHRGYGLAHINTLEGRMTVCEGDWIICGVHGELYPCKNNIFKETYNAVQ